MSIGWGQGKVEVEKHRQEILDLLAGGWTVRRIFLHLQESRNIAVSLRAFYRAVKGLLPAPVDVGDTPHYSPVSGVPLQARAARKPRVVKQPASLITTTAPTAPVPEGPSPEQEETRSSLSGMVFSRGKPGDGAGTW
ncbi:hypothetical protein [Insolitispirillum peregrinum]|uniref:Uncharacterized protein n=1 Tax=Insolitispirillum peregrinum TaxID=80876 RepID=A0A1N7MHL5_9PROT|nr:hypothetical protein [Insolitispirillum peregrinum]SIS85625.1 hypothetical protein SAMN05421779_104130 [Insolitispirillum peregrinum]